ncbi:phosphoglycolate phosphatase [Shewanella sp. NIFS-20-20]|uniref:phosphoglycolate phosphatase n=1 Tax=Shewanella sp. NIFS-20-20 TaxID=2853806 RepID=UPI001C4376C2|nr:phosphoglycolate phosphatase [Shewanella sp. NIFS-20-20]MBV7315637.1 phosphoglycolate phosphatase [Shewanella sp. NIFS-20-20]
MINHQDIKAIAFDLDGTLVDSVPDLCAATQATLVQLGWESCDQVQVRSWVGNGAQMLMRRAMTHGLSRSVTADELAVAMPVFMQHYQANLHSKSQLYPEVLSVLTRLKAQGYRLAVITNKPHRFSVPLLASFGLTELFEMVLGGDSLAAMKPDPLPLNHLLSEWRLMPEQLIMVGDSKNDILAAKAANVRSIGLTYGYNYGEDIGLYGPDAVYDQFSEILTWFPQA